MNILPHDPDAERALIGAVIVAPELAERLHSIPAEAFYLRSHQQIWDAIISLHQRGISPDLRMVAHELRARSQIEQVGGVEYLAGCEGASYLADNYARIVLECAQRRRLIEIASALAAQAYTGGEPGDLIRRTQEWLGQSHRFGGGSRGDEISAADLEQLDIPELEWVVPCLVPAGLSLLIGGPKRRKSWLALALALAVATGGRALGHIAVEQGDALYLALEDSRRRLQDRQRQILCGLRAPRNLFYRTVAPTVDAGLVGEIDRWIAQRERARLVVIDVLARVRGASRANNAYDEDYSVLAPLQRLAQQRGVGLLVLHHTRKAGAADDWLDVINGSTALSGAADAILVLDYPRGEEIATLRITGRDVDDHELALRWDAQTSQWIMVGNADEVRASRERQRIVQLLRDERRPLTARDICEAIGGRYDAVRQLLYRMARDGDITRDGRGYSAAPVKLIEEEVRQ